MAPAIASTMADWPAAEVFAHATDPAHFREGSRASSTLT